MQLYKEIVAKLNELVRDLNQPPKTGPSRM
jgi:hypothetical protein